MPEPKEGENRKDFVKRCVPIVIDDGTAEDGDQAVAICNSMWEKTKKSKGEQETLITFGSSIKALGDGKIGGYLIRFSGSEDPDLEGEFFTDETDFGDYDGAPVFYHHGLDPKVGKRKLGWATHKSDDFGIWAEAQLEMRDEYEKFIYEMAESGKLGWSSGTANHLVEYENRGKALWVKSWPLGLDDTITPMPAEPRNGVIPLKSWNPTETLLLEVHAEGAGDASQGTGGNGSGGKYKSLQKKALQLLAGMLLGEENEPKGNT